MIEKVIGVTFLLILAYIFVYKSRESSELIKALASGYTDSVKALQGR